MKENKNTITWINGLKGLACLVVFFHHFFLTFIRGVYYGKTVESVTESGIDIKLGYKPYGVLLNGNFAVCLFIMISAFLFARKTFMTQIEGGKTDLLPIMAKRYLRLMLTVLPAGILYYLMIGLSDALNTNAAGIYPVASPARLLLSAVVIMWFRSDSSVLGPLWCIYALFIGTFIAVTFASLSNKERKFMPLVYAALSVLISLLDIYYLPVGVGIFIADIYCYDRVGQWKLNFLKNKAVRIIGGIALIVLGLFFGGYPSYDTPENFIYLFIGFIGNTTPVFAHTLGAVLLMAGCMSLPKTCFLSSKPLNYLGDISFGVYLLHTIMINCFSYYIRMYFGNAGMSYMGSVWVTFGISAAIVIVASVLYHMLIEKNINKLLSRLFSHKK